MSSSVTRLAFSIDIPLLVDVMLRPEMLTPLAEMLKPFSFVGGVSVKSLNPDLRLRVVLTH